jgi:hypothetical protein
MSVSSFGRKTLVLLDKLLHLLQHGSPNGITHSHVASVIDVTSIHYDTVTLFFLQHTKKIRGCGQLATVRRMELHVLLICSWRYCVNEAL